MTRNGGASKGSKAESCAFMGRLDLLTTAIYPHELAQEDEGDSPPPFSLTSFSAVLSALAGIVNLSGHVFRPLVVVCLSALLVLGIARNYCIAAGLALLVHRTFFDGRFEELRRLSHLRPGLHCGRTARTDAIISMVPALQHPHYKGTPWIIGGDLATLYPFLAFRSIAFHVPVVKYARRWLSVDADDTRLTGTKAQKVGCGDGSNGGIGANHDSSDSLDGFTTCGGTPSATGAVPSAADGHGTGGDGKGLDAGDDKEAVALDIALPDTGLDPSKPFYLVLHGLTGGSAEPYVLDFVTHALGRCSGLCVMISRGCMGTPVRGDNFFHGARISDVRSTVTALRRSLPEHTPLVMVGYSMGGIIATNYAALTGEKSGVSCCVSMSGSFDTRTNLESRHSQQVWQPLLAMALKEHFVLSNTREIVKRGLDVSAIEACKNVLDIDTHLVAPYNGYPDVMAYYADMSAAADGKIAGLRTPTLAVTSLDDPIMTADGSPIAEVDTIKNLFILLTRNGGHVGWPTGWNPNRNRWGWMSTTSLDFCEAVVATADL
ncbi:unnamed protein product [Ectocarpus sp. 12 AP-2014]